MRLAEQKVPLARDVIFLAEADEGQGQYNTSWLAREHWNEMEAEFALNEGGYALEGDDGVVRQINVTTSEKLSVIFSLKATGPSGHSSRPLPPDQTANGRLIAALARLSAHQPSVKLVPASEAYFRALLPLSGDKTAVALRSLLEARDQHVRDAAGRELVAAAGADAPLMGALLRDTMVTTMIKAGIKPNVIPGEAEAIVNTRLLPGTTTDEMIAEL